MSEIVKCPCAHEGCERFFETPVRPDGALMPGTTKPKGWVIAGNRYPPAVDLDRPVVRFFCQEHRDLTWEREDHQRLEQQLGCTVTFAE